MSNQLVILRYKYQCYASIWNISFTLSGTLLKVHRRLIILEWKHVLLPKFWRLDQGSTELFHTGVNKILCPGLCKNLSHNMEASDIWKRSESHETIDAENGWSPGMHLLFLIISITFKIIFYIIILSRSVYWFLSLYVRYLWVEFVGYSWCTVKGGSRFVFQMYYSKCI